MARYSIYCLEEEHEAPINYEARFHYFEIHFPNMAHWWHKIVHCGHINYSLVSSVLARMATFPGMVAFSRHDLGCIVVKVPGGLTKDVARKEAALFANHILLGE